MAPNRTSAKIVFMNTYKQPKSPQSAALGQLFQDARGDQLQREVAQAVGVHENTYRQWERGITVPDVLQLLELARFLNRTVDYFLAPLSGPAAQEEQAEYHVGLPQRGTHAVYRGAYCYVPLFDLRAGAGASALQDSSAVLEMHCFVADYLANELGISHSELLMFQMAGSLAEPDIHADDLVLVDLTDRSIVTEGPHLVRVDQALVIKTLHRRPGRIVVSSNRAGSGAFEVDLENLVDGDFEVLGRCRWHGGSLD